MITTLREAERDPLITGIAEVVSMKETVEMMHNMFPATNKVYAISDVTTQGTTDLGDYLELRADFPKLDLRYISLADYSYTQLPAVLKKIPADVPILYLAAYCDKEGVSLPFDKSVAYLNRYIKSPLFHLWEHGIKDPGMIGGKALSFFHQGRYAASLVMAILNGKDISKMKVMTKGNNAYMFNYNELMRFNVDMTTLPRNAVIFNEPESFIEKYKNIFIGMSFVILCCWPSSCCLKFQQTEEKDDGYTYGVARRFAEKQGRYRQDKHLLQHYYRADSCRSVHKRPGEQLRLCHFKQPDKEIPQLRCT